MKRSAGILLFKKVNGQIAFFLVHPGGPFFARKNEGFWTVPKGEIDDQELPLLAARREFAEETGVEINGDFFELKPIVQKGGKKVFCWALQADLDAANIKSNTFQIEWPPRSGKNQIFPEIDQAEWFKYADAKKYINERQIDFLDQVMNVFA
ncbi:NUDIX domain-containing protein [Pedobacter sp. AW1-32]|uniref:NUDIX domain-containing protein n=1 Tax=Pedobacter sp. AW1-32 TaxID=3383026 RepID=UPI003FEE14DB